MGRTNGYIRNTILDAVGGAKAVSEALGISRTAVYQWHGVVPDARIPEFCRLFRVSPDAVRMSNERQIRSLSSRYPTPGFTPAEIRILKALAARYPDTPAGFHPVSPSPRVTIGKNSSCRKKTPVRHQYRCAPTEGDDHG